MRTLGLGTLGSRKVKIWRRWSHVLETCWDTRWMSVLLRCAETEPVKGGCDLFSSPSSQKQIIQQLIHNNTNNKCHWLQSHCWIAHICMRSLLYEKRYRSAFAVTYLAWVSEVSVLATLSSAPWYFSVYTRNDLCSLRPSWYTWYTIHDIYRIWCQYRSHLVHKALGRRASESRLLPWSATASSCWTYYKLHTTLY